MITYHCDINLNPIREQMRKGNNKAAARLLIHCARTRPAKLARRFVAFMGAGKENHHDLDQDQHIKVLLIAEQMVYDKE